MTKGRPADPQQPENERDEDAIAFAQGIFDLARKGVAKLLAPLIEAGVPIDMRTSEGDTLLMLATRHGHPETVRLLLARGANPDRADHQQRTPLMQAAIADHAEIVDQLLAAGANTTLADENGQTALDLANTHQAAAATRRLERA